jgi:hypothetical protein
MAGADWRVFMSCRCGQVAMYGWTIWNELVGNARDWMVDYTKNGRDRRVGRKKGVLALLLMLSAPYALIVVALFCRGNQLRGAIGVVTSLELTIRRGR